LVLYTVQILTQNENDKVKGERKKKNLLPKISKLQFSGIGLKQRKLPGQNGLSLQSIFHLRTDLCGGKNACLSSLNFEHS
jgi:hypothetical protein